MKEKGFNASAMKKVQSAMNNEAIESSVRRSGRRKEKEATEFDF
jgi:hypothetical protein